MNTRINFHIPGLVVLYSTLCFFLLLKVGGVILLEYLPCSNLFGTCRNTFFNYSVSSIGGNISIFEPFGYGAAENKILYIKAEQSLKRDKKFISPSPLDRRDK